MSNIKTVYDGEVLWAGFRDNVAAAMSQKDKEHHYFVDAALTVARRKKGVFGLSTGPKEVVLAVVFDPHKGTVRGSFTHGTSREMCNVSYGNFLEAAIQAGWLTV